MILQHLEDQEGEKSFDINNESPIANLETPGKETFPPAEFDPNSADKAPYHLEIGSLEKIVE
jgi:hypothetical protein